MTTTLTHRAAFMAGAAGVVHVVILITTAWLEFSLLTGAFAASVVYALVVGSGPAPQAATARRDDHSRELADVARRICKSAGLFILTLIAVLGVLWPTMAAFGQSADFYCSPAAPWRIEIAALGAFVISMIRCMSSSLRYTNVVDMLIFASLFWIAPFYAFFCAPYFLGLNILTLCPDRDVLDVVLASAAMILASALGNSIGDFLAGRS